MILRTDPSAWTPPRARVSAGAISPTKRFGITCELAGADEFREFCAGCGETVSVAQLDRAADFGSAGWGFESLQARAGFGT